MFMLIKSRRLIYKDIKRAKCMADNSLQHELFAKQCLLQLKSSLVTGKVFYNIGKGFSVIFILIVSTLFLTNGW